MSLIIELDEEQAQQLQRVAESQRVNASQFVLRLIENALAAPLSEKESVSGRIALYEEFRQAASDPLFMQDVAETQEAFASADAQTARMLSDD